MEFLAVLAVLVAGALALTWVRHQRDRQDATYVDPTGGVSISSDPPRTSAAPFHRFATVLRSQPFDVTRTRDEGFDVTCFMLPTGYSHRVDRPCALVELPVDPPRFEMAEAGAVPAGVGRATAEELRYLSGVRAETAFHALLVQSIAAPAPTVQRAALRVAKALVADARSAGPPVGSAS